MRSRLVRLARRDVKTPLKLSGAAMVKILALLSNALVFVWLVGVLIYEQFALSSSEYAALMLIFTHASLNVWLILNFVPARNSGREAGFISLFFEARRLEQQKRIADLKRAIGDGVGE